MHSELGLDLESLSSSPSDEDEAQRDKDGRDPNNAPSSLRVLGVEIGGLRRVHQYVICTAVLFLFTLLYGYLQELVSIYVFERRFSLFVTLLQFGGYTFFAFILWASREGTKSNVPVMYSVVLAVLQASMQGLSNLSMRYLNYPAKVLFKSSRVLPTMLFGVVFYGKRYTLFEYFSIVLLVVGLVMFMGTDATSSPEFEPVGVILITASLLVDAGIINLQEYMFTQFQSNEEEMIFTSYAGGSLLLVLVCMGTGEMNDGLLFLHQKTDSMRTIFTMVIFAACGFAGVSCVAALTKRFGALVAAITTTARKAMTLVLSFVVFPKPFLPGHLIGIVLFVTALVMKSRTTRPQPRSTNRRSESPIPLKMDVKVESPGEGDDGDLQRASMGSS